MYSIHCTCVKFSYWYLGGWYNLIKKMFNIGVLNNNETHSNIENREKNKQNATVKVKQRWMRNLKVGEARRRRERWRTRGRCRSVVQGKRGIRETTRNKISKHAHVIPQIYIAPFTCVELVFVSHFHSFLRFILLVSGTDGTLIVG